MAPKGETLFTFHHTIPSPHSPADQISTFEKTSGGSHTTHLAKINKNKVLSTFLEKHAAPLLPCGYIRKFLVDSLGSFGAQTQTVTRPRKQVGIWVTPAEVTSPPPPEWHQPPSISKQKNTPQFL